MTTSSISHDGQGSFLLELLRFAGWQVRIHQGPPPRIRAVRNAVELDVTGASLAEAVGIVFARAMRSSHDTHQPKAGGRWTM